LHEALVTQELRARIDRARAEGWLVESTPVDDAAVADILARHIHDRARDRMARIPVSTPDRRGRQVDLANRLLQALADDSGSVADDWLVEADAQLMLEVGDPSAIHRVGKPRPRPGIPLRDSVLLVNGHKDLQIGTQVA